MKCRHAQKMLVSYLDGTLSPQKGDSLRRHLSMCVACSTALSAMERTQKVLGGLDRVESPPWLTQKIMIRIGEEASPKHSLLERFFYPLRIKIPLQAFAAVLVVGLAVLLFRANEPIYDTARPKSPQERAATKTEAPMGQPREQAVEAPPLQSRPETTGGDETRGEKPAPVVTDTSERPAAEGPEKKRAVPATPEPMAAPPAPVVAPAAPVAATGGSRDTSAKSEAFRAAPQAGARKAARPAKSIEIAMTSADVEAASGRIVEALEAAGAPVISTESGQDIRLITADVKGYDLDTLIRRLESMGASVAAQPEPDADQTATVRIEITLRQSPP